MSQRWYAATVLLMVSGAVAEVGMEQDTCSDEAGPWSCLLEEWATSASTNLTHRLGRVMSLPPTKGYYVTDRIDGPLIPPPPPPHYAHQYPSQHHQHPQHGLHSGQYSVQQHNTAQHNVQQHNMAQHNVQQHNMAQHNVQQHNVPQNNVQQHNVPPSYYDEWQASPPPPPGVGKIVNRPPNPYKDQFKPSYPPPAPNPAIPLPAADRVDASSPPVPPKRVTETDLYLLTAIEKLVYRVDLMEKRLRKMEEAVHRLVVGPEPKPEPCEAEFRRVGAVCYHFSAEALDWKSANLRCRKLHANLLEFDSDDERRQIQTLLLTDKRLRGDDWWTGGLNPGLLWIWSHSARPVLNDTGAANGTAGGPSNGPSNGPIAGEGRCLLLAHRPAVLSYSYRGEDCAARNRFVCEQPPDAARLANDLEAAVVELKHTNTTVREARLLVLSRLDV